MSPRKPHPPRVPTRAQAPAPAPAIVERPDGYYWIGDGHLGEFGPFESYELARADRDAGSEQALAPTDTLQGVEQQTGVADWIDAQTGEPSEDGPATHLPPE